MPSGKAGASGFRYLDDSEGSCLQRPSPHIDPSSNLEKKLTNSEGHIYIRCSPRESSTVADDQCRISYGAGVHLRIMGISLWYAYDDDGCTWLC